MAESSEERLVQQSEPRISLAALIAISCVAFLLVDYATPRLFKDPFCAMICLAIVTAQLTVICVWGTLVEGTFWVRLPWTFLLLMVSWCAFAAGTALNHSGVIDMQDSFGIGIMWFVGFVTSFVPLKIAALCFRWRIVQFAKDQEQPKKSGYAIRDIMIGTGLLALTMAIARAMLPAESGLAEIADAIAANQLNRTEPIIAISIFGVISLLVKLPCIWIALRAGTARFKRSVIRWVFYCLLLAVIEIVLLMCIMGPPGPEAIELFAGIIIGHQVMGGIMLVVCRALHGVGYRLERGTVL